MTKRFGLLVGITGAVGGVLLASAALAGPTTTVDGVTFPVGLIPGGNQLLSGILDESSVAAKGDMLSGFGRIDTINDTSSNPVWQNGDNNVELAFVFSGYTVRDITSSTVDFTGGSITFYTLPKGFSLTGGANLAADEAAIASSATKTWLTEVGAPVDSSGDTLISSLDSGSFLSSVFAGHGDGALDVTGGDAASFFHTLSFVNAFDTANGGFSDETLTSDFSTGSCPPNSGINVCGSGTIKANAAVPVRVPEPATLGLLGAGLACLSLVWGRKSHN